MKTAMAILCVVLFLTGLVSLTYCQPEGSKESPAQVETTSDLIFKVSELGGTDSDCKYIEEATNGRFNDLIPQWCNGLFGPGNKVRVVEVSKKLLVPLNKSARVGADGQELVTRSFQWAVRPLGANLEDLAGHDKAGKLKMFRPYFAALTKGGSVIRGGSVYGLSPDELSVVLRVTPGKDKGHVLTFIRISE
jgi:hypothetical protein